MCWQADSNDARASQAVRKSMASYLRERVTNPERVPEAELVIGELLGNVARHSPGPFCAEILWDADRHPVVAVHDGGRCFEFDDKDAARDDESGRGLTIVQKLVEEVDVAFMPPEGCVVRATLALEHRDDIPIALDACPLRAPDDKPVCMLPAKLRPSSS